MENKIEFDIFINGEKINLVVLDENIIEKTNWYKWFNDSEITKNMQKHYFPNTMNLQKLFFKNEIENNPNKLQLGILHKESQFLIGAVSLNDIDFINKLCEISIIIGEKKYHSLDFFVESCELIINHGFNTLGLNRIYSGSFSKDIDNLFCKLLSFESEGILKQAVFKDGKFHDVYICARINKCYK